MSRETHLLIYVAPLLEHEFDLFKVGHTTIAGIKGRRSQLRRELSEPKLELYPMVVYPPDTPESTVRIHERDLVWLISQRSLSLFQHPTTNIKYEVVYFPTTPAMRFWGESEPDKREISFRVFLRAFLLGEQGGSSQPIPLQQVTTLLDQRRKEWQRVREVRFEDECAKRKQYSEQRLRQQRREKRNVGSASYKRSRKKKRDWSISNGLKPHDESKGFDHAAS